jgi:hypothetical protein
VFTEYQRLHGKQMQSALKAVQAYMMQAATQAQVTGQKPVVDLPTIAQAVTKQQMLDNNPKLAAMQAQEEQKAQK